MVGLLCSGSADVRRLRTERTKGGRIAFRRFEYRGMVHTAWIFRDAVRQKVNHLKLHPFIGSIEWQLTTSAHEYRYLLLKPYKIIYSDKDDVIRIHLFWHTRRNPNSLVNYPIGLNEPSEPYGTNKDR